MNELTYRSAGVDRDASENAKRAAFDALETAEERVLNRPGAFAGLYAAAFPGYREPVLVVKTEEPGSKQQLAFRDGRIESICRDMIHHLLNDIAVMGAEPLFVQDAILCGRLEEGVVTRIIHALADVCREYGCVLTGGETSEQPGVIPDGTYLLTSSVVGVVERERIVDGTLVREGDVLIALASNGLHTNGYSLVRALLERSPDLAERKVDSGEETFLEQLLRPHVCYLPLLRRWFGRPTLHGLAHITGGGIGENLNRILPQTVDACVDRSLVVTPPLFRFIREHGRLSESEMWRTFNMGVGLVAVVAPDAAEAYIREARENGTNAYRIGVIEPGGSGSVKLIGDMAEGEEVGRL